MDGTLLMLGTVIVEGGLVYFLMWLLTSGEREAQREEEARRRLAVLESAEERLRKAA